MFSLVQQTSSSASGGTISAPAITVGAGDTLIILIVQTTAAQQTLSGNGNTYSFIGASPQETNYLLAYLCQNANAGSTAVTSPFAAGNFYSAIYVADCSGLALSGGANAWAFNGINGPGSGANTITTGNLTTTIPNTVLFGFSCDVSALGGSTAVAATAGTSPIAFTGGTGVWPNGNASAMSGIPEYKVLSSTGTYAATWGASGGGSGNQFDLFVTFAVAIALLPPGYISDGTSTTATATTGTGGTAMSAISVGQVLDILLMAQTSTNLSDSLAWVGTSGGTLTQIQSNGPNNGFKFDHWQCVVTNPVAAPALQVVWSGGTLTQSAIAVAIIPASININSGNPLSVGNYNLQPQTSPSGTDGQVSGNTSPLTTVPAYYASAFGFSAGEATPPTTGTGFTSQGTCWAGLGGACLSWEVKSVTGTGAAFGATFTPVSGSASFTTVAVFNIAGQSVSITPSVGAMAGAGVATAESTGFDIVPQTA